MTKKATNLIELRQLAEHFLESLSKLPISENAMTVGLSGDLGSGKTAFTKCVADALGIKDLVTSPTFILEKVYAIPRGSVFGDRFSRLVHIDAYRLESAGEMEALDWKSLLEDERSLIFLEWPEQIEGVLPKDLIRLNFEYEGEGVRNVSGELL